MNAIWREPLELLARKKLDNVVVKTNGKDTSVISIKVNTKYFHPIYSNPDEINLIRSRENPFLLDMNSECF